MAALAEQLVESRVARLESDVTHIRADIAEMKLDIRELRAEVAKLHEKFAQLEHKLTRGLAANRIWTLLQSAAILGVIARGFKWL